MFILILFTFNSDFVIKKIAKRKQPSLAAFGKEAKESKNENVNRTTFSSPAVSGVRVDFDSSTLRERPADAEPEEASEEASTTATASGSTCTSEHDADDAHDGLPFNWTLKRWSEWKEKYPWLFIKNKKCGCEICKEAKTILISLPLAEKSTGVHLSPENGFREKSAVINKITCEKRSISTIRARHTKKQSQFRR